MPVGNFINNVNGLTILTSVTLVIIQHVFNDFRQNILSINTKYDKLNLPKNFDGTPEYINNVRKNLDTLLTGLEKRLTIADTIKTGIVDILFFFLFAYALIHLSIDCTIFQYHHIALFLAIISALFTLLMAVSFAFIIYLRYSRKSIELIENIISSFRTNNGIN